MLCNPMSDYPYTVDKITYFQDTNLENIEILNHYNSLISQGKYNEANNYIGLHENIYGFFAAFFNLIENRIFALQGYLLNKPPKKQPFVYYDEEVHFPMVELHIFDDADEEEDLSTISLFSDNDEQESIDNLYTFIGEEAEPADADEDTIWI